MAVAHSEPAPSADENPARFSSLRSHVRSRFGIDARALAAFRIGLGLVIVLDLLVLRTPGLETFYTHDGIFPRSALAETSPALARWSLHAISGSVWAQTLLIGCACIVAACLLVGYRARAAAVGSALLLASLHARNPYLVNGGDTILISVLFLAAFLPLDERWSLRGHDRHGEKRVVSVATATVLLHVVCLYAINAVLKFRSDEWMTGVAVRRIFQLEDFLYLLGPIIAEYPAALTAINWLWVAVLSASVLLVFSTGWLRSITVGAFVGAHLGMAATMRLGAFPFVMCIVLLLFLPSRIWEYSDRLLARSGLVPALESVDTEERGGRSKSQSSVSVRSPPVRRGIRVARTALLVCFLITVVGWQTVSADLVDAPSVAANDTLEGASWAFFAPNPPDSYSWYVVVATSESGDRVDLVDGGAAEFDRPPDAMERYPTTLWKRYGTKGQGAGDALHQPAATYFCERSPDDVESVTVYRVDQPVDTDGPVGEPTPHELVSATCGR
ncbi:HTTM domain-containing protein [Natrialbaceae archaeon GCM10025810]|uniref:HTTM domain-containing protein n=1 Tax=Halovalidus salilacus TaxID=3075124 RepID=UPI003609CA41